MKEQTSVERGQEKLETIKKLRVITAAPISDCKKALEDTNYDLEAARQLIKERGLIVGVLRGAKDTSQGVVTATTTSETPNNTESHYGTITCLSCESDSVAKLDDFIAMATEIALYTVENDNLMLETLQKEFESKISELMSTVKESVKLSYYSHLDGDHISIYNHQTNKLSVLVKFNKEVDAQVGKNIAMQVAGMKPLFVDYDDIPQSVLIAEKESALKKTKEVNQGKDDNLIERIAEGRIKKSKDAMTLMNQPYTQGEKQTVRQYLESVDKDLKVLAFRSFEIG